jgi:hypothetical protein
LHFIQRIEASPAFPPTHPSAVVLFAQGGLIGIVEGRAP